MALLLTKDTWVEAISCASHMSGMMDEVPAKQVIEKSHLRNAFKRPTTWKREVHIAFVKCSPPHPLRLEEMG